MDVIRTCCVCGGGGGGVTFCLHDYFHSICSAELFLRVIQMFFLAFTLAGICFSSRFASHDFFVPLRTINNQGYTTRTG